MVHSRTQITVEGGGGGVKDKRGKENENFILLQHTHQKDIVTYQVCFLERMTVDFQMLEKVINY